MQELSTSAPETPPLLVIAGPTASGKSALALRLADAVGGEIVNADSMQVYADLPVLTAIPSRDELDQVPHHGYGIMDGAERCSVAAWLEITRTIVSDVRARGKPPILVGGTGMYLRAALEGIAPLPDVPEIIRQQAIDLLQELGGAAYRRKLAELDPVLADRLEDGDSQRLVRGMEIALATGQLLSQLQQAPPEGMLGGPQVRILVEPPREDLYRRIDQRFPLMLDAGGLEEARRFTGRQLDPTLPLMKAVGLPPLRQHLAGEITLEAAVELACRDTRRFAKRQLTWFRHQFKANFTHNGEQNKQYMKSFFSKILSKVIF